MRYESPKWVKRYSKRDIAHEVLEPNMPRIDDGILESIAYLYASEAEANAGDKTGGTGFIIGIPIPFQQNAPENLVCLVTNKHVVAHGFTTVRVNTNDGKTDIIPLDQAKWYYHSDGDDIAICPIGLSGKHKSAFITVGQFISRELAKMLDIGIGDDVFLRADSSAGMEKKRIPPL